MNHSVRARCANRDLVFNGVATFVASNPRSSVIRVTGIPLGDKAGPLSPYERLAPAIAEVVAEAVGEVGGEQVEEGKQAEECEHAPQTHVCEGERQQRQDDADREAAPGDGAHDEAFASPPALVHLDDRTGDGGDGGALGRRAAAMCADLSLGESGW